MKNIFKIALLSIAALAVSSCSPTPEQMRVNATVNKNRLSNPEIVGETDDGQTVKRAEIIYRCSDCVDNQIHYVYFIGKSISDNYSTRSGKSTIHHVEASINASLTDEEILAKAKEIEKRMKESDEANYQFYKDKLGK